MAPDETDHVNITYGPFSPKYSGNAMGGVIDIFSREPQKEEWALQTTGWVQDWELQQSKGNAPGYKTFFAHGNKIGKISYYMFYNRLETQTQPTNIQTDTSIGGSGGTTVTGPVRFMDARVRDVIVYSDDGEENSINDLFKMRMNYDFSSQFKLRGMIGFLDRHRDQLNVNNYIQDSSGNKLWTGDLSLNGSKFNVSENQFDVSKQDKQDLLIGLGAKGTLANGWNYDVALSTYFVLQDISRDSDENPESSAYDGSGQLTEFSNTGWQMVEIRFDKESLGSSSNLSFEGGYHYDHARMKVENIRSLPDWELSERGAGSLNNSSGGETDTHGVHGNLGMQLSPKWDLQAGLRTEVWRSFNGFKHETAGETGEPVSYTHLTLPTILLV